MLLNIPNKMLLKFNSMKIKSSILLITIAFSSNAQIAGYMGKRFAIGYSNYFFPGIKGPGPNEAELSDEQSPCFNTAHCLNLEYGIKQRTNMCLSIQYLKTGIAYLHSYGDYPYPNDVRYGGNSSIPAQLRSINVGIGFKFFKKGFVAPVGGYRKIEILLLSEKVTYDKNHFFKENSSGYQSQETPYVAGTGEYDYKNIAFSYTIGKQHMLSNILVLDYGIRFGVIPGGIFAMSLEDDSFNSSMESLYREKAWARIYRQQLINFHIGINFLAF
jgi:hypothetical protein